MASRVARADALVMRRNFLTLPPRGHSPRQPWFGPRGLPVQFSSVPSSPTDGTSRGISGVYVSGAPGVVCQRTPDAGLVRFLLPAPPRPMALGPLDPRHRPRAHLRSAGWSMSATEPGHRPPDPRTAEPRTQNLNEDSLEVAAVPVQRTGASARGSTPGGAAPSSNHQVASDVQLQPLGGPSWRQPFRGRCARVASWPRCRSRWSGEPANAWFHRQRPAASALPPADDRFHA